MECKGSPTAGYWRKNRTNLILENTLLTFTEKFFKTTSCHVLDNICSNDSPRASRCLYLITFILLMLIWSYYTAELYAKWNSSPIVISESSKEMSVTSFAFPAITICNLNYAKRSVAEKIEVGTWDYIRLQSVCKAKINVSNDEKTTATDWEPFREFIIKVTHPCDEIIKACRYGSVYLNCRDIFETILTDHGVCCTFNGLDPYYIYTNNYNNRTLDTRQRINYITRVRFSGESGYEEPLPESFYPRKAAGVGVPMGFSVALNASINEYFCSSSRSYGFKFLLHSPTEFPRIANYGSLIRANRETRVQIIPSYRNTAKSVRSLPVSDRKCLYNAESKLENFQIYSSSNCELECTANQMEKRCGCIQFYLPRKSNRTKICGLEDIYCSTQVEKDINDLSKPNGKCNDCLWGCVYFSYNQVITQSHLLAKAPMLDEDLPEGYNVSEIAVVHFYHMHTSLHVTTVEAYLGFLGFFANSGGLYSLFLGFSILSLIEIFYFVVQLFAKILKRHRRKKSLVLIVKRSPHVDGVEKSDPTTCNPIKFQNRRNRLSIIPEEFTLQSFS